jgi:peptidyl-dipeptidase A
VRAVKALPLLALTILATASCGGAQADAPAAVPVAPTPPVVVAPTPPPPPLPTVAEATAYIDDVEQNLHRLWVQRDTAGWVNENFITDDTEALAARGEEATAGYISGAIKGARRFDPIRASLPPDVARRFYLLSLAQAIPAPDNAQERSELATIESAMTSEYGKGRYCPPAGSPLLKYVKRDPKAEGPVCLHLDDLDRVLARSHDFAELTEAWKGWHEISVPMKDRFVRYVDLANKGAREIGFDDVGALWRAGYDMPPADFEADIERLWKEVKPLYDELHCYVRSQLQAKYGKDRVPDRAPIPAQLLGNMWAQEWDNLFGMVEPYPKEPSLDVDARLKAKHLAPKEMVKLGERFFTSLGFDPLPASFWERSLFVRPRDREVVCHASAWDVTWSDDLRIKMCIEPTESDLVTIHHELGHDFYFSRYFKLPILFQQGANDGFHEGIGDTLALSVTPAYLKGVGLLDRVPEGDHARINQQMKMALDKIAFLPFGLLIDKWRWDVFSGKTKPADYNTAWWALKRAYQGVSEPAPRAATAFDPGAKFHVASSTSYIRYFLSHIYQFQFYKALCAASGYQGPLDQCSFYGSRAAGDKLIAMLSMGASRPWPDALEVIGAGRKADAGPLLEYFAPLRKWLAEHNQAGTCGF